MMSKTSTGRTPAHNSAVRQKSETSIASSSSSSSLKPMPSKTNIKVVSPMGNKKHLTVFSAVYSKGGIPCRLSHGSVKHKLTWNQDPVNLDYNPLFVTFCEGLRENQHPYIFLVERGLTALIEAEGSLDKILPLMPNIIAPLRSGLACKEKTQFLTSLQIFLKLVALIGADMEQYLHLILPPIAAKVLSTDAEIREAVHDGLTEVQIHGGEKTLAIIRKRVPTYNPTLSS